jgi:hypothetical protein
MDMVQSQPAKQPNNRLVQSFLGALQLKTVYKPPIDEREKKWIK